MPGRVDDPVDDEHGGDQIVHDEVGERVVRVQLLLQT